VAYVLQISVGAVDLDIKLVIQGHAPEAIILRFASHAKLFPELVGSLYTSEI